MHKSKFNSLIFSNADKIYNYLYCILKNSDDSLVILTNTIEECWNERKNFEHTNLTFVFKIARDLAKAKNNNANKLQEILSLNGSSVNVNPVLIRLCSLTDKLSPIQVELIFLRSMARLTIDEIALIVELGINNIQSMLANVREDIRVQIDPNGILNNLKEHELLPKYYSGKSTIEEEEHLRMHFLSKDLAGISETDREFLQMFMKLTSEEVPQICPEQLALKISEIQKHKKRSIFSRFLKK